MFWAKKFFTQEEQAKIVQSIQEAEKHTSAEIRVHIENFCFGNPVKQAQKVFLKHGMHLTKHHNGVLFYFAVCSKKLAIVADKGIYEKTGPDFWNTMVNNMIESLKQNTYKAETLCKCINQTGKILSKYFPASEENPNELDDEISF